MTESETQNHRAQHFLQPSSEKLFPRWSIPILALIAGLILAISIYARPKVTVYLVPEQTTTTTVPSGDNVEITP